MSVQTSDISPGDMVRYEGGWHVVLRVHAYGMSEITDEIQLRINDCRNEWVPVTELRGLEKRPAR